MQDRQRYVERPIQRDQTYVCCAQAEACIFGSLRRLAVVTTHLGEAVCWLDDGWTSTGQLSASSRCVVTTARLWHFGTMIKHRILLVHM